jgi:predicted  nucleic acid-binding Zn-ribbon protein
MATSMASDKPSLVIGQGEPDPFLSSGTPTAQRHAGFDSHSFALGPGASATSAKQVLEAHLADTDRRMEEAGKLGTALVQQRKELEDRLREVEQLEAEEELSPDLKQKLTSIEKDFNEVARESARAFLPKQRLPSSEVTAGMPFTPDKSGVRVSQTEPGTYLAPADHTVQRSASPSKFDKFETLATGSPSKFSVPNRKLRNQPANRIHDIEFAAEISTSLITQVRNLQTLLQERDEELKDVKADKSSLQREVEGFQQRMRNLDESEMRYKDENWNLETQIQELMAAQKDASDREKKLTNSLQLLQADKNSTQRELDEIKTAYSKLADEHAAAVKHHDIELGMAKRNAVIAEGERAEMQRKLDELTSQNQELAKAMSLERGRASQRNTPSGSSEDDLENAGGNLTPEHSPPPSPIKPTPRHSMLESETLKTSLQHAQRTIQSLRTNVHREKTEKLELKRLLQDARDEIEKMRSDPAERPHHRRAREAKSREFKKPAKLDKLGTSRAVKAEILHLEDPEWEEVATQKGSPPMGHSARMADVTFQSIETDEFETANEAHETTDAFETAHERGTETDDFQTGAEDLFSSDTETESPSKRAAVRANALKRAPILAANQQYSYESTASTSASEDEGDYMDPTRTPNSPAHLMRLRSSRSTMSRRSRQLSDGPSLQSSPATNPNGSFSGPSGMPQQSLFAELNELEGSDEDSVMNTPGQRSLRSVTPGSTATRRTASLASTVPAVPSIPRAMMVDSGMVTETPPQMLTMSAVHAEEVEPLAEPILPPRLGLSDVVYEHIEPSPEPQSLASTLSISGLVAWDVEPIAEPEVPPPAPPTLTMSSVVAEHVEPLAEPEKPLPPLAFSSIFATDVKPVAEPEQPLPTLAISSILAADVEPVAEPEPEPQIVRVVEYVEAPKPPPAELAFSQISTLEVEPVAVPEPQVMRVVEYVDAPRPPPAELAFSLISTAEIEPVAVPQPEPREVRVVEYVDAPKPLPAELVFSPIASTEVEPVAIPEREPRTIRVVEYVEAPKPPPADLSFSSLVGEGIEPQAEPEAPLPSLSLSTIASEHVEPRAEPRPTLSVSGIASQDIEPRSEQKTLPPPLSVSSIVFEHVEPVQPHEDKVVAKKSAHTPLDFSSIHSLETAPVEPHSMKFGKKAIPPLGFSRIESLDTEPVSPISPKRNAVVIPRAQEERPSTTSKGFFGSLFGGGKGQDSEALIIAEDETRQLPSDTPLMGTPQAQLPFREISANVNSNAQPAYKEDIKMSDSGAQTSLTADAIDQILQAKSRQQAHLGHDKSDSVVSASSMGTPGTVRVRQSHESLNSILRSKSKATDADLAAEAASRRPDSSCSARGALKNAPPLPPNHKEAIEAARTGTAGSMGPPLFPASSYKNPLTRPRTPMSSRSVNASIRGTPTPRQDRMDSAHGTVEVHSPTRLTARSRKSSVSSFASEVDARFQNIGGMGMDPHGFGPNTDPRMIQAITQTMIGEYLWKYTRKAGRGEMSEKRHRRYFWVHPYTRTLYWSERDPSNAGRSELRTKSVPIEAVRVVTDDNPMPPGLHRKSLVIISPGRSVKFTCTTGQRHETWFNALSYLLLRTNSDGQADTEEMVNGITREEVDEFNPQYGHRTTAGTRPRAPPSISSYTSQGTRSHSAMNLDVPTLTPNHKKASSSASITRPSFTGRLSGYWKSTQESISTLKSRSGPQDQSSFYDNNEVHDSAEDLRLMYEKQDREADRLDNVRSCCDGQ